MRAHTFVGLVLSMATVAGCGTSTPTTPVTTDSGPTTDAGPATDLGAGMDAGQTLDGGSATDTGTGADTQPTDAGNTTDAAMPDCGPQGDAGPPPDWSCLGHVPAPGTTPAMMTLHWQVLDFVNGHPVPNVVVKACAHADPTCATPLAMATTDAMGNSTLAFARVNPFDGVIDMTGGGTYPTRVFGYKGPDGDMAVIRVLTPSEATLLSTIAGADLDPARGQVVVDVHDCTGAHAASTSIAVSTADAHSQGLYIRETLPDTCVRTTDATGIGAVLNVPVGTARATAAVNPAGTPIGGYTVDVRAGTLQTVLAYPSP